MAVESGENEPGRPELTSVPKTGRHASVHSAPYHADRRFSNDDALQNGSGRGLRAQRCAAQAQLLRHHVTSVCRWIDDVMRSGVFVVRTKASSASFIPSSGSRA